jgi:hypothetical protein
MEKGWKFTIYQIVSYLLVLAAGFLGFILLFILPAALSNPAMLFGVFIIVGVVLYSFTSFRFLKQGLMREQFFRKRFKDLIKVNGYVSVFFVAQTFFVFGGLMMKQDLLYKSVEELFQNPPAGLSEFSKAEQNQIQIKMVKALKIAGWCMFVYAALLTFHLLNTFQFIKRKNHLFSAEDSQKL